MANKNEGLLTFGGHLEVFRKLLFRVCGVVVCIAVVVFAFKEWTFNMLLAPSEWDFITYQKIQDLVRIFNPDFQFSEFNIDLIATDLSSQFMTHLSTALYLGLLGASPYILYELFKFVSPALYDDERRYTLKMVVFIYLLFMVGVLMSYFVIFPISFRFLGTYSVDQRVTSTITLDSYISTFVTLTLLMALVFQLPVISFILGKFGFINAGMLAKYRKQSFIAIMVLAAIITPPDLMTLILVAGPLYLLYEFSIWLLVFTSKKGSKKKAEQDVTMG